MHLVPDSKPFGVDVRLLQQAAWALREPDREINLDDMRRAFAATTRECEDLIRQLVQEGYLTPSAGKPGLYALTGKFAQLCLAKISHGLPREEADTLLSKIVRKAEQHNAFVTADDCYVECVVVFGSYVTTNKPVLGDLDIGVALSEPKNRCQWLPTESSLVWSRRLHAPYRRAEAALRLRQPDKISIHQWAEVVRLMTPYQVVFGTPPTRSSEDSAASEGSIDQDGAKAA